MRAGARPARAGRGPSRDRWLISYADFITLLFALFVVLYAVSSVDLARWQSTAGGVRSAFGGGGGVLEGTPAPLPLDPGDRAATTRANGEDFALQLLEERLDDALARAQAPDGSSPVALHVSERGLVIELSASEFFAPGDSELRPEALQALDAVAQVLATTDHPLRVEGHTDDAPLPPGARYPSNWELSASRAARVVRHLIDAHRVSPRRLAATGFADQRPRAAHGHAGAPAQNRRVEIVVLAPSSAPPASATADAAARAEAAQDESLRTLLEQLPPIEEPPQP